MAGRLLSPTALRMEQGQKPTQAPAAPPQTRDGWRPHQRGKPMATLATATRAAPIATPAAPAPAAKRNADAEAHDRRTIGIGIAVAIAVWIAIAAIAIAGIAIAVAIITPVGTVVAAIAVIAAVTHLLNRLGDGLTIEQGRLRRRGQGMRRRGKEASNGHCRREQEYSGRQHHR